MTRPDLSAALLLGLTGGVPAFLSLFGLYPQWAEILVWSALAAAVWIPVVRARRSPRPFLTLLLAGIASGVVTGLVQGSLLHVLFANVPAQAEAFGPVATPAARAQVFAIDVAIGTVWGLVVGGAEALVRRVRPVAAAGA